MATASLKVHGALRFLLAVVIASAAVIQFWTAISDRLELNRGNSTDEEIDPELRGRLVEYYKQGIFDDCLMHVSLHVWEVPLWYRRLFPYRYRNWAKRILRRINLGEKVIKSLSLRPRLHRVGFEQFDRAEPAGVPFRKGYGLVGFCIEDNDASHAYFADFSDPEVSSLLAQGKEAWKKEKRVELTKNLQFEDAKALAEKYGQAAAMVIRSRYSREPLGCITLSLPPGSSVDLKTEPRALEELEAARKIVIPLMAE